MPAGHHRCHPDGQKELVAMGGGFRESELSWTELLLDIRSRGLAMGPKLSVGDGSLGFWKALSQVYADSRRQRCWVHKTANVLNKLPKSIQPSAKEKFTKSGKRIQKGSETPL